MSLRKYSQVPPQSCKRAPFRFCVGSQMAASTGRPSRAPPRGRLTWPVASSIRVRKAPVAQLDRAPDYESGGQEFESLRARHFATIQNKTANSANPGGRLMVFQSRSIFGGERKSACRSPVHSSRSFRFDCRHGLDHSAALRRRSLVKLAARKSAVGVGSPVKSAKGAAAGWH